MNRYFLWYLLYFVFWLFNFSFGSSHIASSAYQIWPTWNLLYFQSYYHENQDVIRFFLPNSKFENKLRNISFPKKMNDVKILLFTIIHLFLLIISFTWYNYFLLDFSNPAGKFGRNQLLDGSMGLSPLYSDSTNNLHVSIATNFHQSFLWLYSFQV